MSTKEVFFSDIITMDSIFFLKEEIQKTDKNNGLDIYLNSAGGSVSVGIGLYNILKKKTSDGANIKIIITGEATSIASIILLGVPLANRLACLGTSVLIHEVRFVLQEVVLKGVDVEEMEQQLKVDNENIASIYELETNLSKEQIISFMSKETKFSTQDLISHGFINKLQTYESVASSGIPTSLEIKNNKISLINKKEITMSIFNNKVKFTVENKDLILNKFEVGATAVFGENKDFDLKQAVSMDNKKYNLVIEKGVLNAISLDSENKEEEEKKEENTVNEILATMSKVVESINGFDERLKAIENKANINTSAIIPQGRAVAENSGDPIIVDKTFAKAQKDRVVSIKEINNQLERKNI